MNDYFSHLNLRVDAIDERQQEHAQDPHELLHRQIEFDYVMPLTPIGLEPSLLKIFKTNGQSFP